MSPTSRLTLAATDVCEDPAQYGPFTCSGSLPGVAAPAVTCRRYRMRAQPTDIVLVDSLARYRSARSMGAQDTEMARSRWPVKSAEPHRATPPPGY